MTKREFIESSTVIAFEHLIIPRELVQKISRHIQGASNQAVEIELEELFKAKQAKYSALSEYVKLVYLFLTEGMQHAVTGRLLGVVQDEAICRSFSNWQKKQGASDPPMLLIGIQELRPILASVELSAGGDLAKFLLKEDGTGGYDTPKIAAALIQLARRDFARQEMFVRVDDDVEPNAPALKRLKKVYYELTHDEANKYFCFSWNYSDKPLDTLHINDIKGPDYPELFRHYVNSYSIRTTFFGDPSVQCQPDPQLQKLVPFGDLKAPCFLNLVHTHYFIDLFKQGKWGSDLRAPISGAAMCFSPEALIDLPPWCNADELITWIDDFAKWQTMAIYFGDRFDQQMGLLEAIDCPGFRQDRNDPEKFTIGNVDWSANVYLDRLLMGCILSYCIDPSRYSDNRLPGYGEVLKERDYLVAQYGWHDMQEALKREATEHVRKVLADWHHVFCEKQGTSSPGYITHPPEPPTGFIPAPANTFFNAYTLKQLIAIERGTFDLVARVLNVLERYLELKFRFWPHVLENIDRRRSAYLEKGETNSAAWLFAGLDKLGKPLPHRKARTSKATIALITRQSAAGCTEWLLQWNRKWKAMHLISGHIEDQDPNELACVIREVHEELFEALEDGALYTMYDAVRGSDEYHGARSRRWRDQYIKAVTKNASSPGAFTSYVEFSTSAQVWTEYEFTIYQVALTAAGEKRLFHHNPFLVAGQGKPEGPNEWVGREEIQRGWTKMGRPISDTVKRILGKDVEG
jgi:hypothetical protein